MEKAPFLFISVRSPTFSKTLSLLWNLYKSWGAATKKKPSKPLQPWPEAPRQSTYLHTRIWSGCWPGLNAGKKRKNIEMLANGKTTEENQSPLERVPALLE